VLGFLLGLEMVRDDFSANFTDITDAAMGDTRTFARRRFERMILPETSVPYANGH